MLKNVFLFSKPVFLIYFFFHSPLVSFFGQLPNPRLFLWRLPKPRIWLGQLSQEDETYLSLTAKPTFISYVQGNNYQIIYKYKQTIKENENSSCSRINNISCVIYWYLFSRCWLMVRGQMMKRTCHCLALPFNERIIKLFASEKNNYGK